MVGIAAGIFLAGLIYSFTTLYGFERQVRTLRRLERPLVGRTLRRLVAAGLVSGVGIGLLGLSGFVWGRESPPGASAYAWAVVFVSLAIFGWPAILTAGFMARVNTLNHRIGE